MGTGLRPYRSPSLAIVPAVKGRHLADAMTGDVVIPVDAEVLVWKSSECHVEPGLRFVTPGTCHFCHTRPSAGQK